MAADEPAPSGVPARATGAALQSAEPGVDLAELARLQQSANGGAEEEAAKLSAGYDAKDGFFLRSKDDLFLLKIGGQLQARYTYKARDQRGDTVDAGEVGGEDDSFFELERLRVTFSGHVLDPNLTYRFQVDGDTDDSGRWDTLDAYIYYKAGDDFFGDKDLLGIGVGQWKPHFLRQEATSSSALQMVDRSLANEFFNIDRNLGVWVSGDAGPVFYELAVTNGFDSVNVAPSGVDQMPAFLAHVDLNIAGAPQGGRYEESNPACDDTVHFSIGGSLGTDYNNGSSGTGGAIDPNSFTAYQFGLDTVFKWSVISLQAEYMGRWLRYHDATNTAAAGDTGSNYAHGFYIQGGVFLIPETLELTGRVSAIWADGPASGSGVEAGPGLNWYISKSHKIKLQTDVMFIDISSNLPNASESLNQDPVDDPFSSSASNLEAGEQGIMWRTQIQLSF